MFMSTNRGSKRQFLIEFLRGFQGFSRIIFNPLEIASILHWKQSRTKMLHSLKGGQISFHTKQNYYLKNYCLWKFEAKTRAHQFIKFRRHIEHAGKKQENGPCLRNFNSSVN